MNIFYRLFLCITLLFVTWGTFYVSILCDIYKPKAVSLHGSPTENAHVLNFSRKQFATATIVSIKYYVPEEMILGILAELEVLEEKQQVIDNTYLSSLSQRSLLDENVVRNIVCDIKAMLLN